MARPVGGAEHLEAAKELLHAAKTAAELRQAQAVLLPLEFDPAGPATLFTRTQFSRAYPG